MPLQQDVAVRLLNATDPTGNAIRTSIVGSLAKSVYAITPSDTVDLAQGSTVGLYVGGSGDVVVITDGGTTVTFTSLSSGMIHPISAKRVKATGTTATGLLAVY